MKTTREIQWIVVLSLLFTTTSLTRAEIVKPITNLTDKQQTIIPIAAFTATGKIDRLKTALNEGLDAGLTVNEIKEILVQMYAYAGFPRSLNGLGTFMTVLKEREEKGIKDTVGKEPGPFPADRTVLELGTEVQTKISGAPVKGPLFDFAPAIDFFLKAHLFGDIFGRDNLDFQSREIATISALASLDGVESQLQSHFKIGMNVGLTETQLRELVAVLETKVGKNESSRAKTVLNKHLGLEDVNPKKDTDIIIVRNDERKSEFFEQENFTGLVRRESLFADADKSNISSGFVTFKPGARNVWHTHPRGQMLIITDGTGRVQKWGGPILEVKRGDVVWFPADVKHWHGAAPTTAMTHIAITENEDGNAVEWLEPVTDEQYGPSENK